ncbi:hypothetical protein [Pseudoxanthomonas dokdonensis]|uniref:Lectin n=1 Tax=Pseudoxanthomonas dokdonensis TaxID=344882 RepID=A0A0R0CTD9_9GAMM|nr:hypothetical protein [Pseudoxanthomonas dokdonensis]KRG69578.1 hypothetical protein ABB29_08865 [Pseudoxanthomonas dokdonensis]
MKTLPFACMLSVLTLVACQRDDPGDPPAPVDASTPAVADAGAATPAQTQTAATATSDKDDPAAAEDAEMATLAGFGDLVLGSSEADARAAWGGELKGPADNPQDCHYLTPAWVKRPADLAFMMEAGKFVRYDVGSDRQVAPGGGRVGMSGDELQALYSGKLQSSPHKYVPEGKVLSIGAGVPGDGKLVFEAGADGKVSAWRVGLAPQVDYVEGCS